MSNLSMKQSGTFTWRNMSNPNNGKNKPARRKSDLTLLGTSSQDLDDRVYTIEFGVNLAQITFEGLNNYSVSIECRDKTTDTTERLSSVLEIRLREKNNSISIEGGPPCTFAVFHNTLNLTNPELDESIVGAVNNGIAWLTGDFGKDWVKENRRRVPDEILKDGIAINLLMSSISTLIAGSLACHDSVIKGNQGPFSNREDYVNAMYDQLRGRLDELTVTAINRGIQRYVATS